MPVGPSWVGHEISALEAELGIRAAYVLRFSKVLMVEASTRVTGKRRVVLFRCESQREAVASRLARNFKE
ncbi:Uncharacterised protein [Mobiluncus curtisii]|uniref:Uncharacterized protein n=1 Tax=Mobiluncus curtisii TaxID=2051 RepID=A0A2X3BL15_9ACTO|nr:Uncharacterised protein [Mobiluncus curtisii]